MNSPGSKPTPAIPTQYAGIWFRSRLEARWAAFFDLLEWPWEYEPLELDGYIPDFILRFYRPLLVEVKPIIQRDVIWGDSEERPAELSGVIQKIYRSGWPHEFVIAGCNLFAVGCWQGAAAIGWLCERESDDWIEPAILIQCEHCWKKSIIHCLASYRCRYCGFSDGDHHIHRVVQTEEVKTLWSASGNTTQWKVSDVPPAQ